MGSFPKIVSIYLPRKIWSHFSIHQSALSTEGTGALISNCLKPVLFMYSELDKCPYLHVFRTSTVAIFICFVQLSRQSGKITVLVSIHPWQTKDDLFTRQNRNKQSNKGRFIDGINRNNKGKL